MELKNHELVGWQDVPGVLYEEHPLRDDAGKDVAGLHSVRITLDNPKQLNSYTTDMVRGVILVITSYSIHYTKLYEPGSPADKGRGSGPWRSRPEDPR